MIVAAIATSASNIRNHNSNNNNNRHSHHNNRHSSRRRHRPAGAPTTTMIIIIRPLLREAAREGRAQRMQVLFLCHNNHSRHSVSRRQVSLTTSFVSPLSTEEVRVGGTTLQTTTTTTLEMVLLSWIPVPTTTTRHPYCRQDQETDIILSRLPVVMTFLRFNFHRFEIYAVSLKRRKKNK